MLFTRFSFHQHQFLVSVFDFQYLFFFLTIQFFCIILVNRFLFVFSMITSLLLSFLFLSIYKHTLFFLSLQCFSNSVYDCRGFMCFFFLLRFLLLLKYAVLAVGIISQSKFSFFLYVALNTAIPFLLFLFSVVVAGFFLLHQVFFITFQRRV